VREHSPFVRTLARAIERHRNEPDRLATRDASRVQYQFFMCAERPMRGNAKASNLELCTAITEVPATADRQCSQQRKEVDRIEGRLKANDPTRAHAILCNMSDETSYASRKRTRDTRKAARRIVTQRTLFNRTRTHRDR
jgi:hypothetical protein